MIKVLLVSSDSNIGGAGRVILSYLEMCDREKFDILVAIPRDSLLKPRIEKLGFKTYEVEGIAEKSLSFQTIKSFIKLIKEYKPDIVHTNACMSARIAGRICGVKGIVFTRHTVYPPKKMLTVFPFKQFNGLINTLTCDKIIAVADAAKENLAQTGVKGDKIVVVLNGTKPIQTLEGEEISAVKERFKIKEGDFVCALVARLEEGKGHYYFIDAAEELKKRGRQVKFIAAGTGALENELRAEVKNRGLEDCVDFVGFITDVEKLTAICDVELNCSYGCEATSLALVEAMSCKKPCVVTDSGGNSGVVKDGVSGFVVKPCDAFAMADAIEKLMSDGQLYEKMSDGALKLYNEKFTAEVMTKNTESIYEELVK